MPRKRANTTKDKNTAEVKKKPKPRPLQEAEAMYFKELVETSNRVAALMKQKAQYEYVIGKLQENRKKIQTGKVKLPVTIVLIPKIMYYQEDSKKEIFKFFDEQIAAYRNSVKSLEGQIGHRQEEYEESAVRNKEFLNKRYEHLKAQKVTHGRDQVKDEENIFEAEFEQMMQDPKVMEQFREAKKEAIKKNTQRATKIKKAK